VSSSLEISFAARSFESSAMVLVCILACSVRRETEDARRRLQRHETWSHVLRLTSCDSFNNLGDEIQPRLDLRRVLLVQVAPVGLADFVGAQALRHVERMRH